MKMARPKSSRTVARASFSERGWIRISCALAGAIGCLFVAQATLRAGFSRSESQLAITKSSVANATQAIRLSPEDPETYKSRALALARHGELSLTIEDLRTAIRLRPGDYDLWSRLGRALDDDGETSSALAAFIEAQRLAPGYGTANWDLGLAFFKSGRRDEGLRHLRTAALNNPSLLSAVMEKAWEEYRGDFGEIEKAVQPRSSAERLELAIFAIKHVSAEQTLAFVLHSKNLTANDRRHLIRALVEAKRFTEAYAISKSIDAQSNVPTGTIDNASFESGQLLQESAFAWDLSRPDPALKISVEQNEQIDRDRGRDANSLRMDWNGNPNSDEPIAQLLLVAPNTHYELSFVARARNLITGGSPILQITDVSQKEQILATSPDLPLGSGDWQKVNVQFTTGASARAVRIGIRRNPCSQQPCPIFGTLNLDDFSLQQIDTFVTRPRQRVAIAGSHNARNSE